MSGVFPSHFPSHSLTQDLPLNVELTDWLQCMSKTSGDHPVFARPVLGLHMCLAVSRFYQSAGH